MNPNPSITDVFTIYGGSGDLTFRKLLPAMYNLHVRGKLADGMAILAIGRRDLDSAAYREMAEPWISEFSRLDHSPEHFASFAARLHYFRMDISAPANYAGLRTYYQENFPGARKHNYYAVAPRFFAPITEGLIQNDLVGPNDQVVVEKPFGTDLATAKALDDRLSKAYGKDHHYRIDHYLGKEMIQNIMTVRCTNAIFSGIWDAEHIHHVEISAPEAVDVETRGGYYDQSGAIRDMVQNHLFQLLSIVAMEPPADDSNEALTKAQLDVIRAFRMPTTMDIADHLVLGQYLGYREAPKVAPDSKTETYAAMKLFIDNDRWRNVPFYIRTGKAMDSRQTYIAVVFKRTKPDVPENILMIRIQPDEGIYLSFNVKEPGDTYKIAPARLDYCQSCNLYSHRNTPEAYERLLLAMFEGDQSLFSGWEQIELSWHFVNIMMEDARMVDLPLYSYERGSTGPKEAERLFENGFRWLRGMKDLGIEI